MADILYVYENNVYLNLTNRCCCHCTFCIRSNGNGLGSARTLWHETDPDWTEVKAAVDRFDFTGYPELTFCGYGEPACVPDLLVQTAHYMKSVHPSIRLRVNTNGLGNLISGRDILPALARSVDRLSISLNAPDQNTYNAVCRPDFPDAFPALLDFAGKAKQLIPEVTFTVVDVISPEEIRRCRELAAQMGIALRIRRYDGTKQS